MPQTRKKPKGQIVTFVTDQKTGKVHPITASNGQHATHIQPGKTFRPVLNMAGRAGAGHRAWLTRQKNKQQGIPPANPRSQRKPGKQPITPPTPKPVPPPSIPKPTQQAQPKPKTPSIIWPKMTAPKGKITPRNYGELIIPETGIVGKKYAPLLDWANVPKDAAPPDLNDPACKDFEDYAFDDAPDGILKELRWAFLQNRIAVSQGRDPVNVLLQGPPGTGKTISVRRFAAEMGLPYYYCPINAGLVSAEQLLGRKEIEIKDDGKGGKVYTTEWHDGPITQATKTGGILHIDEASLMDPEVSTKLYELMDSNRRLSMQTLKGKVEYANPDLFIVLSGNPIELGIESAKPLPTPFKSRVRGILMDYAPIPSELKIVKAKAGLTDEELKIQGTQITGTLATPMENFMRALNDIRKPATARDLSYVPTTREAVAFGIELKSGATPKAALQRTLIGKYVGDDRPKIVQATQAFFPSAASP